MADQNILKDHRHSLQQPQATLDSSAQRKAMLRDAQLNQIGQQNLKFTARNSEQRYEAVNRNSSKENN